MLSYMIDCLDMINILQTISQLSLQIAQMKEMLLSRRKVAVIRVG
jgi:hypothetical protein